VEMNVLTPKIGTFQMSTKITVSLKRLQRFWYTVFIVQAYQTSQYVVPRGGVFLVQYTRCSLCRLIRFLSTWCRAAAFFSASGAALSQEIPTVKWMSNQPALWTPDIISVIYGDHLPKWNCIWSIFRKLTTHRLNGKWYAIYLHRSFILVSFAVRNKTVIFLSARDSNFGPHIIFLACFVISLQLFPSHSFLIYHSGNQQITTCDLNFSLVLLNARENQ
jgi:hypothetical protein